MAKALPKHARAVIVGGGIVGCSIAYHLAKLGWSDTVLLEQGQISCGTTWHAAGLVAQLRATQSQTNLAKYTLDLYRDLEAETGQATGFRQTGSISLARTAAREEELKRQAAMAVAFGVEIHRISFDEVTEKAPMLRTDDLVAAYFMPGDGTTNPTDTSQALAKGARANGATIAEGVKVTQVLTKNGAASGVVTDQGEITADYVVLCGGMWTRDLARPLGVTVPLHAAEHMYMVTRPLEGVVRGQPVIRDMDGYIYIKEEVGGLLIGGFEPDAKPWGGDGIPEGFEFALFDEDWDQFDIFLQNGIQRVPSLENAEVRQLLVGPESFTPDNRYIVGEAPTVDRLFVAAGFNSIGIQSAGGVGMALAEWIVDGAPTYDLNDIDIGRFHPYQINRNYLHDRTTESVGLLYAMHWPFRQPETARGARRSPIHEHLVLSGACFGTAFGWERPNWFSPDDPDPQYEYSWGRQNWFEPSAEEHRAAREDVAIFDQTSFAKFLVQGRDAETVLQEVCAGDVAVPPGRAVYTQWLNPQGGIEADLTVTRLAEDEYIVVTGAASATRDFAWLKRHIGDRFAIATDVTSGVCMLGLMGPKSRDLLNAVCKADLSNDGFPFLASQEIEIGYARVRAQRITYVGELGWELYMPTEFAAHVYETLVEAGRPFDLRPAGYHAMDSLRAEKGYRHWGHDITGIDTPVEAGLGFAVGWNKNVDFVGRAAVEAQRGKPLPKRLVLFKLTDPEPLMYHDEPIYRDGTRVGAISSAAYGHTLGASVGMGYVEHEGGVDKAYLEAGSFEVDIAGERVPAEASLRPFYDPTSARVKV
ncbi:MAG: FAD-dependent oxidoreductase [Rhodospirillaceae bacterium]|nr:FAD-dependent oxidoreductase [Rhodospirillaceae bacterium]MDD9929080.1 FAD-dependent oxidoreductase [Rhodospirillaceae bacterium]